VATLSRGREAYAADERVLGCGDFVEELCRQVERQEAQRRMLSRRAPNLATLSERVAKASNLLPQALVGGGRNRNISRARDGLAYLWVEVLGRSGRELARALHIQPVSICRAVQRGRKQQEMWRALLQEYCK
jgi:chromosomal replication initiation ATPase DnaA